MGFQKAVKAKSKLRAAMFGPSGSGKTYSALAIASGMGEKIALMDSEKSSASLYADRFDFDQVDLVDKNIDEYVFYIDEAAKAGYDVLIIDSLSHAWEVLNEEVQKIADTSFKGNFWSAWSKGTPMQRKLIDAIVSFPGHIIATMRSKTEWQTGSDANGRRAGPVRVGLAPEQGKGIEYEFTVLFELSTEHLAHIIKDRTGKFQDKIIEKPGKEFGQQLVAWLNDGVIPLADQIQAALLEIGNIIKSKSESGAMYFTDQEYERIRLMCKESGKQSHEARLDFLKNILVEQKKVLQERVDQFEAPAPVDDSQAVKQETPPPAAPPKPSKQEAPPQAPETSKPAIPALPDEEKLPPKKLPEDVAPIAEGAAPATEDFDNDIPWEEIDKPSSTQETLAIGKAGEVSLTQAFKDYLREHEKDSAVATAEELDIF